LCLRSSPHWLSVTVEFFDSPKLGQHFTRLRGVADRYDLQMVQIDVLNHFAARRPTVPAPDTIQADAQGYGNRPSLAGE
jgi:hypothetical protein